MNTPLLRLAIIALLSISASAAFTGCKKSTADKAADSVNDAADKTADAVGDAAHDVKDAVKK